MKTDRQVRRTGPESERRKHGCRRIEPESASRDTEQRKSEPASGRRVPAVRIAVALVGLIGLALILYPTVANFVNGYQNSRAISDYREQVEAIPPDTCRAMLDEAVAYNAELARLHPYFRDLTAREREAYNALLDVTGTGILGYLQIEKLGLSLAVYHGTSDAVLQVGAGHLEGSSLPVPGESVHTVLSGHSGLPSASIFTDLDQLEPGDTFTLHVLRETYTYQVEQMETVLPEQLEDMHVLPGEEICTLLTCTPYGVNTHRLVVTARRIETPAGTPAEPPSFADRFIGWLLRNPYLYLALGLLGLCVFVLIRSNRRKKRGRAGKGSPQND